MIILDTDHLSILHQNTIEAFNLGRRLAQVPPAEVFVSIVTYEEQMRGWLAYVAKASDQTHQVDAYRKLRQHFDQFRQVPLVDYDAPAAAVYQEMRANRVRIGAMDLKIASIAIANGALLLSRNLSDFNKVPRLRVDDWSL